MKRSFWWRKQGPSPLFPRQTRVRNYCAATGGIIYSIWILYGNAPWQFFVPARRFPTWFRWRRSGRKAESESGGDGLLANPRIVARRRFQPFGRRHRNRSCGFCCFSPPKSREREKSFFLVLLGPKVPKASARRFPRDCAIRGAARGAQDQAYAPPRGGRAAARTLFFRVKRECGFIVPPAAALLYNALWKPVSTYLSCPPPAACHFCFAKPTTLATPFFLFPQGDSRLGSDGEKADGGLKATAAGTVCLQTRAVARRRFQTSGRRHRNRSGGFCCFSPSKSREKRVFSERRKRTSRGFLLLFATEKQRKRKKIVHVLLRPKVPKASARRSLRECASRGAARGAQDQAYAPPRGGRAAARTLFFRVKRECGFIVPPAAALLYNALWKPVSTYLSCPPPAACHFCFAKPTTLATPFFLFPQGDSRLGSDGEKADGGLKATAAGTVCLQTRAVARRRFQASGRRHRNRSGGFCCFSTPKSREKEKERDKNSSPHRKKCGSRVPSEAAI